jgi:hypothetical protein
MAEWSGRERRRFGTQESSTGSATSASAATDAAPTAPAAIASPQIPGEVPDRSSVPGQAAVDLSRATDVRRPLTENETAQGIMKFFAAELGQERDSTRFELATASFEEMRKADLAQVPPIRPAPGYHLAAGEPTASIVAIAAGEVANTSPAATLKAAHTPAAMADPQAPPMSTVSEQGTPTVAPAQPPTPSGAIAGDGTAECPSSYPIKGNANLMIYHTPGLAAYARTIADFCFVSTEAAEAAGFRLPRQ